MNNRDGQMMEHSDQHDNTQQNKSALGMGLKMGFMMMLCCLLPIMLVGVLPLFGFENVNWSWVLFLLCPLMHVGMMFFMKDHHK